MWFYIDIVFLPIIHLHRYLSSWGTMADAFVDILSCHKGASGDKRCLRSLQPFVWYQNSCMNISPAGKCFAPVAISRDHNFHKKQCFANVDPVFHLTNICNWRLKRLDRILALRLGIAWLISFPSDVNQTVMILHFVVKSIGKSWKV